jgi:hypothetical protein
MRDQKRVRVIPIAGNYGSPIKKTLRAPIHQVNRQGNVNRLFLAALVSVALEKREAAQVPVCGAERFKTPTVWLRGRRSGIEAGEGEFIFSHQSFQERCERGIPKIRAVECAEHVATVDKNPDLDTHKPLFEIGNPSKQAATGVVSQVYIETP